MTVHLIRTLCAEDCNIYLVSGTKPIIVDAGGGRCSDYVIKEINRLSPIPPTCIIATHCHFDHVGGLRKLVDSFGCEVKAGFRDAKYIREDDPSHTLTDLFDETVRPVPEVQDLHEGDIIDTGDHRFTVLETPGHSEGSICLYEPETGILISGDTVFTRAYGRTDFPGGSNAVMIDSLKRLSDLDIRELYPGHENTSKNFTGDNIRDILRKMGAL